MFALTPNQAALLIIVGGALVMIVSGRVRPDLVAVLVLLSLGLSGILRPEQALAGFSQPAVVTIVGLFAITAALERTGVVLMMGPGGYSFRDFARVGAGLALVCLLVLLVGMPLFWGIGC